MHSDTDDGFTNNYNTFGAIKFHSSVIQEGRLIPVQFIQLPGDL